MNHCVKTYLEEKKKDKEKVRICTLNGSRIFGIIDDYDEKGMVVIDSKDKKKHLLFYHGIVSIHREESSAFHPD